MKPPTHAPCYLFLFPGLAEVAQEHGYALAIHGSISSDLDFVASPWVDDAVPAKELALAFFKYAELFTGVPFDPTHRLATPELKPHGRKAWTIPLDSGASIDLSVMPMRFDLMLENTLLKQALSIVREYPDFDHGGPMVDMMDEVLQGKYSNLIKYVNDMRNLHE
jgi:hypothetical protein